jgi:hypothetical protein
MFIFYRFPKIVGMLMLFLSTNSIAMTADTRSLVNCEAVYIYYAQYFQMNNNEGAAKNLLFRASRLTAAYLLLNLEDGVVSGKKIGEFKTIQRQVKARLDADPIGGLSQATACDKKSPPIVSRVSARGIIWQGKNHQQLSEFLLNGMLGSMGIR